MPKKKSHKEPPDEPAISMMSAPTNIPVPERFDHTGGHNQAESWPKWVRRFQRYRFASGLCNKSDREQVCTLLYAMGDSADDILTTLSVKEDEVTFDELIIELEAYFGVRKNTLVERAKFNRRRQMPGESVETFIQELHRIADDCGYRSLKEELIRDRIIVGVLDESLSDRLQMRQDLTLQDAIKMARQNEARKENRDLMRGETEATSTINMVRNKKPWAKKRGKEDTCQWCGGQRHPRHQCPAKDLICLACNKKGHFKAVCRADKAAQVANEVEQTDEILSFLGEIYSVDHTNSWTETILVNGQSEIFKLDTGASVTVLSDKAKCLENLQLVKSNRTLQGPGQTNLKILGSTKVNLSVSEISIMEEVFVIENQKHSLLSRDACVKLQLIQRSTPGPEAVNELLPDFKNEYSDLFKGLGTLSHPYMIQITEGVKPLCLYTPRKVPIPLMDKVRKELDSMQTSGVISPVEEPTEWCSGLVTVMKPNGNVRLCVDLTQLNKAVKREIYPMKSVQDSLTQMAGAKIFSKLDANSGFWQIPLDEESKLLTTFITPFGRFKFNRLPFGISSAPEIFQRAMSVIIEGLEGVICHMDDILIFGSSTQEHDNRVRAVMERIKKSGMTLNNKCEFSQTEIKFLGHLISAEGIKADPKKIEAVIEFPKPKNVTELQRFLGMVNHLGKFIPSLADTTKALRELLKKGNEWRWDSCQDKSMEIIKSMLSSAPVLTHYNPELKTIISADASRQGLGAVLMQVQQDGQRGVVAYASRSLIDAEQRYAVIELEALASTWACEQFKDFVLGMSFTLETDHKPLVSLLGSQDLSKMPVRVQRFKLRLMRFTYEIEYVPGKQQITADALSRSPVKSTCQVEIEEVLEVEAAASTAIHVIPATTQRLKQIESAQSMDAITSEIIRYCKTGWPKYAPHNPALKPYFDVQGHLSIADNLLLYDERIVIPQQMQLEILECIHQGHLGITKCRSRASETVWWPGWSVAIENLVKNCNTCAITRPATKEPLMPSPFPERPWERIAMDLCMYKSAVYLIVIDYYSRWIEFRKLTGTTSASTIQCLKSMFSSHGIPEVVVSDNGTQFASSLFQDFAKEYNFTHITSSPRYPASNGEAERAVRTFKELVKKNKNPDLALLVHRSTPLANGLSPSELLMGRKLRTPLPILPKKLMPGVNSNKLEMAKEKEDDMREKSKVNFDIRHKAKDLTPLKQGDRVWIRDQEREGVVENEPAPRSVNIRTEEGTVRRNRAAVVKLSQESSPKAPKDKPCITNPGRPSRQIIAPKRLDL